MKKERLDERRARSPADQASAARAALGRREHRQSPSPATIWRWDLSSGEVEWDDTLMALFGYTESVTDAAWREQRIHPDDRERVKTSMERATIVNHGAQWSEQFRFRRADGSYAEVTERAYVVSDGAGPREVIAALGPHPRGAEPGGPAAAPILLKTWEAGALHGHTARTEEVP